MIRVAHAKICRNGIFREAVLGVRRAADLNWRGFDGRMFAPTARVPPAAGT
jgi:hypothetical protein